MIYKLLIVIPIVIVLAACSKSADTGIIPNSSKRDTAIFIPYAEVYKGAISAWEGDVFSDWCTCYYSGTLTLSHIGNKMLRVSFTYELCDTSRKVTSDEDSLVLFRNKTSNISNWMSKDSVHWGQSTSIPKGCGGTRRVYFNGAKS
jgi:hypothetical protein